MRLAERHARLRRQQRDSAAWRLLRAENAPLVLAFVGELFERESEVPFGQARVALDEALATWREAGALDSEATAASYLRQWIASGWLRELDDRLSATDACEVALRFAHQLEQRDTHATASHLRIVQDAVRDLAVDLNPDPQARAAVVQQRIDALGRELEALSRGVVHELSAPEQRERVREVYQLASVLTADFRRMEDEVRQLDHALRVDMIESGAGRGAVLRQLLDREEGLAGSEAGRAFNGFFALLRDPDRSTELREQLRAILATPAATHLSTAQSRFLAHLLRELNRESERVLRVRRRIEESLRAFIDSGAHAEHRAVGRLLGQLERLAVAFAEAELPPSTDIGFRLNSGKLTVRSPTGMRPRAPEQVVDAREFAAPLHRSGPSEQMLAQMESVEVRAVAGRMRDALRETGPASVASLIAHSPVEAGIEELVAHLRVAQAVGGVRLTGEESVELSDLDGSRLRATIPHYLLSHDQFPEHLDEIPL